MKRKLRPGTQLQWGRMTTTTVDGKIKKDRHGGQDTEEQRNKKWTRSERVWFGDRLRKCCSIKMQLILWLRGWETENFMKGGSDDPWLD